MAKLRRHYLERVKVELLVDLSSSDSDNDGDSGGNRVVEAMPTMRAMAV